jgi:hypothetical protein
MKEFFKNNFLLIFAIIFKIIYMLAWKENPFGIISFISAILQIFYWIRFDLYQNIKNNIFFLILLTSYLIVEKQEFPSVVGFLLSLIYFISLLIQLTIWLVIGTKKIIAFLKKKNEIKIRKTESF